jgi:hypothetical protein
MRVPRLWFLPRCTLRGLMATVAVAGAIVWGGRLRMLSATYRIVAAKYRSDQAAFESAAEAYRRPGNGISGATFTDSETGESKDLTREETAEVMLWSAKYSESRARAFERAARHPWLPVAPEPK